MLRTWMLLGAVALYAAAGVGTIAAPPSMVIETVAGDGTDAGANPSGPALRTAVAQPFGVELGPDGALYVTSVGQHRVLRLDLAKHELTSVAGNGTRGYAGDGAAASRAQLNEPYEVRFDRAGNMFFVEMQNHLIRRVDTRTGVISTVAGKGEPGFAGDGGPARQAQFRQPHSIALDEQGNIFVADIGNHRIRRIDATSGAITTIAGTGERTLPKEGAGVQGKPILGPRALAVAGRTLWVALREGHSVWRIDLDTLLIHHVAGTGQQGYTGDGGPAKAATFNGPKGIAASSDGLVLVVDSENQVVRAIDTKSGLIYTVAGAGPKARGFAGEKVNALTAKLDRPHGIGIDRGGGFYLGDTNNHRVRWVHP